MLDPEIAIFIAKLRAAWRAYPPLDTLTPSEARTVAQAVRAPWREGGPEMDSVHNLTVDTTVGPLGVRLYRPVGLKDGPAPTLLYLHGGGFVYFSLDTHDRLMREYAAAGGFAVLGIDYPLAPEARYPVALDRIVALIEQLEQEGPALGIDPARLAIGGDSAGANLAIAACLKLRDSGSPAGLVAILSNYGAFSGHCSDEAEAAHGGPEAILTQSEMAWYFEQYLGSSAERDTRYACPLDMADLADLPPIFLVVPERDVLAEQSFALAARLEQAGVETIGKVYPGATHSFLEAMSISSVARIAIADGARWVAERFSSHGRRLPAANAVGIQPGGSAR